MIDARALHISRFGAAADVVVRSPGRINLIGDHTDYCGLPVLPMAIRQAVYVAASVDPTPGLSAYSSLDESGMDEEPSWAKYVRAVMEQLLPMAPEAGARIAIASDLPATGGLSSSSALTIGCLIALNELWNLGLTPTHLIEAGFVAERTAAIAGGAMDQTVIALAEPGNALRIEFDPPRHTQVPMPESFTWIAGYSGEEAPKGESAADSYNSFVLTSRAAATMLGAVPADDGQPAQLSTVFDSPQSDVDRLPQLRVADAALLSGGDLLGLDPDRMLDLAASATHVLAEARRVDDAEGALREGNIGEFGRLMNESHASLRRYGSSTEALDRLAAASIDGGAAGARVTGAGFGGWAIALAPTTTAEGVRAAMELACGGPTFVATAEGGALWSLNTE